MIGLIIFMFSHTCSPLEQAARGGLLHLSQRLHGQDLNDINDHSRNLKQTTETEKNTCEILSKASVRPIQERCLSLPRS